MAFDCHCQLSQSHEFHCWIEVADDRATVLTIQVHVHSHWQLQINFILMRKLFSRRVAVKTFHIYIICSGVILVNKNAKFWGMGSGLFAVGNKRLVFKLLQSAWAWLMVKRTSQQNTGTSDNISWLLTLPTLSCGHIFHQSCSRCSFPPSTSCPGIEFKHDTTRCGPTESAGQLVKTPRLTLRHSRSIGVSFTWEQVLHSRNLVVPGVFALQLLHNGMIVDDCMVGIEMNWAVGRNQNGALVALVSKLPWSLGNNGVWTREPPYLLRPWATFRSSTRQGPPMPGRKFRKNWNSYNKPMAHRNVFEMHKQWRVEAVRCIDKLANGCKWWLKCQWNDIKESMHNWPNEPMNQWIGEKEWISESMKQWINEPMTQSQSWLWGRFRAAPSIAVFYVFYVKSSSRYSLVHILPTWSFESAPRTSVLNIFKCKSCSH